MSNAMKIRLAIGTVVLGIVAWSVYYIATHGRLVIDNKADETITITSLEAKDSTLSPEQVGNGSFIKSGSYTVQNNRGGQVRLAHVDIPGWLRGAHITYGDIKTAKVERQAALTFENFFPVNSDGFASYTDIDGYTSKVTSHSKPDAFGGKSQDTNLTTYLLSPVVTGAGQLVGINDHMLFKYSPVSRQLSTLASLESSKDVNDSHSPIVVRRSSALSGSRIGIYEDESDTLKIVDDNGKVTSHEAVSTGSRGMVFDVNQYGWAVVKNTSETPRSSNVGAEENKLPYEVTIAQDGTSQTTKLDIGLASYISAIALSPDGQYIAVSKDGYLWVYNVTAKKVVIVNPVANANQLFWGGIKLYTLSAELGVTVFDTTTKQILPISLNTSERLSFSKAIPVGTKLYVTAYNTDFESDLPDGYVIDLETGSDGITEALAKSLPIMTKDYDINYLGNTIYVRIRDIKASPSATEDIKQAARNRLNQVVPEAILKRCQIVFTT